MTYPTSTPARIASIGARRAAVAASAIFACVFAPPAAPSAARAEEVSVGRGSYNTTPPPGVKMPSTEKGAPARPAVVPSASTPGAATPGAAGQPPTGAAAPTTDWWTSLIWKRRPESPFSENLYAHPLALRAKSDGLGVSYPTHVAVDPKGRNYNMGYAEDLSVGAAGLAARETLVAGYGDWTVTAQWADASRTFTATIGHGLPYVYCRIAGPAGAGTVGDAFVTSRMKMKVWSNSGPVAALTVNNHHYALFAPTGATWLPHGTGLQSALAGKGYFSVALLPDDKPATLTLFRDHAYVFITGTSVDWQYDEPAACLTTHYAVATKVMEGMEKRPLLALYRHQWLNMDARPAASSDGPLAGHIIPDIEYVSPRGQMKLMEGTTFTTRLPFHGVLPVLPGPGTADPAKLKQFLQDAVKADKPLAVKDTYWTGKELGRLACLAGVADQAGLTADRDVFVARIRTELEDWFRAPDGKAGKLFCYDRTWGSLIGCPAGYGSDSQLNDHHFHYGYFIQAAAAVARFDRKWANHGAWGGMVELLIRDCANPDRAEKRFPFLRCYDPYAGHSWASGHAAFAAGNNQESSSESLNFAAGVLLWGAAVGDTYLRDLGIFLYANEAAAVQQYWFDVDQAVLPKSFLHSTLGMVWGNGGAYATWWTANPEEIHGINYLPITGASLYLGWRPDYVLRNYKDLVATNPGPEEEWRDLVWSFQALADADAAAAKLDAHLDAPATSGGSTANTYHWIHALQALGKVDTKVTADIPTFAVFDKAGKKTHAAWNPTEQPATVTFSDGVKMQVPPGKVAAK